MSEFANPGFFSHTRVPKLCPIKYSGAGYFGGWIWGNCSATEFCLDEGLGEGKDFFVKYVVVVQVLNPCMTRGMMLILILLVVNLLLYFIAAFCVGQ